MIPKIILLSLVGATVVVAKPLLNDTEEDQQSLATALPVEIQWDAKPDDTTVVNLKSEEKRLPVTAKPNWITENAWYRTCEVVIRNLSEEALKHVKIEFDYTQGKPQPHTGTGAFSDNGKHITTYLEDWKLPVTSGQEQRVKIGFNYADGSGLSANLPHRFHINDLPIFPEDDVTPPSIPQEVNASRLTTQGAEIKWNPSIDNVAVQHYEVSYYPAQTPNQIKSEIVKEPEILLKGLLPNQTYNVQVSAIDVSGNRSEPSSVLSFNTLEDMEKPPVPNGKVSSPFVDGMGWPTPDLVDLKVRSGVNGFFVGFVVDHQGKPCWGGLLNTYDSNTGVQDSSDARESNYRKQFFAQHPGSVIYIGGAAGLPMASNATLTSDDLVSMYKGIIANYGLKGLDFDFEGGFLGDDNALNRHLEAIRLLRKDDPETWVSYTLPVDGSATLQGFNFFGENFLKQVKDKGIQPSIVQGMLMEFGEGSGDSLFEASKVALEGMHKQLKSIFGATEEVATGWTDEETWKHIGACPMLGRNNNGKVFNLEDQAKLNTYCLEKGVQVMSGWDMLRDTRMSPEELGVSNHTPFAFSQKIAEYHVEQ